MIKAIRDITFILLIALSAPASAAETALPISARVVTVTVKDGPHGPCIVCPDCKDTVNSPLPECTE